MVIERIRPGYYYLSKQDKIDYVPRAVVGGDTHAARHFKEIGALGYWYCQDTIDYNQMLIEISKIRREQTE